MAAADAVKEMSDPLLRERLQGLRDELKKRTDAGTCLKSGALSVGEASDFDLALYLLGWNLEVKKAADAVAASQKFRAESGADSIRAAVRDGMQPALFPMHDKVQEAWPNSLCGVGLPDCRDGMPAASAQIGRADLEKLGETVPLDDFKKYMIHVMEYRLKVMEDRTAGGRICRWVDVHDLHCPRGLVSTFSSKNIGFFRWWVSSLAPHYPEQVRKVFVVNVPGVFHGGWRMAKTWLPKRTLEKTAILPTDFRELREMVEPEGLPIHLGLSSPGGDSAQSFEGPGQGSVQIPRGKGVEVTVPLRESEEAQWQFYVKAHDVGFSASFASGEPGSPLSPVTAAGRHGAAAGKVEGEFKAPSDGVLCLKWDNSFSWARGKTVEYSVTTA
eukprot:TRINITY_DN4021_c1_g2_i1.p1 TRINITY_DN4021_c1_g2~~TRINITY_DN4021_c1_g2_i1.p1  ORF type:complete len:410 (+),score=129.71 TRINITY_DN4021_c1_g2_i1:74-1231(+)